MSAPDSFLRPTSSIATLDTFGGRRQLLDAVLRHRSALHGTLLDVGCGDMPYKSLLTGDASRVTRYIGLDLPQSGYHQPDLGWDGAHIPLETGSVDSAMATEVLEHCPDPVAVLREIARVLKPGAPFFFTVPFLWPLHCSPHDHYRFTPFALEQLLTRGGFGDIRLEALGGWDASLGQMLGLWLRRRPMPRVVRWPLSLAAWPFVAALFRRDRPGPVTTDNTMLTGIAGVATNRREN